MEIKEASHAIKNEGDHGLHNMMSEIIGINEESFYTLKIELAYNQNTLM